MKDWFLEYQIKPDYIMWCNNIIKFKWYQFKLCFAIIKTPDQNLIVLEFKLTFQIESL